MCIINYKGIKIIFNENDDVWECECDYGKYNNQSVAKIKAWIDRKEKEGNNRINLHFCLNCGALIAPSQEMCDICKKVRERGMNGKIEEKICLKALEEIRNNFLKENISASDMELRSDKMVYNFLICIGHKKIAESWYFNKT